jgi:hypothetical protein
MKRIVLLYIVYIIGRLYHGEIFLLQIELKKLKNSQKKGGVQRHAKSNQKDSFCFLRRHGIAVPCTV